MCLPSRLNIQRQSVSQWYPCVWTLCWGSDLYRQKSYQNAQQPNRTQPPLDQQNGNNSSLKLVEQSYWMIKCFRGKNEIIQDIVFICTSNTGRGEGCKRPVYRCALKRTVWDLQSGYQVKVEEAERRRSKGLYTSGCLRMTGTFTNEEILYICVGMQACITSQWQWIAGTCLVSLVANWCCKSHFKNKCKFNSSDAQN